MAELIDTIESAKVIMEVAKNATDISDKEYNYKKHISTIRKDFTESILEEKGKGASKAEKKEIRKECNKAFGKLLAMTYNDGVRVDKNSIKDYTEQFAFLIKWFDAIDSSALRDALDEVGLTVHIDDPSEFNTIGISEATSQNINNSIVAAVATMEEIRKCSDSIKIEAFEELPAELRYSADNKTGIRPAQFKSIVEIEAMKNSNPEKAESKVETMNENLTSSLVSINTIINTIN